MNDDVIVLGFRRGVDVHLICTDKGLNQIPDPCRMGKRVHPYTGMRDVWVAATVPNTIALLMANLITHNDATKILEGVLP